MQADQNSASGRSSCGRKSPIYVRDIRQQTRDQLASTEFDLVIIGAGIHGAFAAWDAALRGWRVALIDRGDFGGATSANSMKIAHGGLRYLQHADVARAWQSARERAFLFCVAPHLVTPLPCVLPTRGRAARGPLALRAGLALNDAVTGLAAIRGCDVALPANRVLSRDEYRGSAGAFAVGDANGGALWHDGLITSTERFLIEVVRAAIAAGAVAMNHVEATDVLTTHGRVSGVRATTVEGDRLDIRARAVLNAAGPWALTVAPTPGAPALPLVRSCNAVVDRASERVAAAVPAKDGRLLFTVPWRGRTIVGTTQAAQGGPALHPADIERDVRALVAQLNRSLPRLDLSASEVTFVHAGVLPGTAASGTGGDTPANRPLLIDHASDGRRGLVTMAGVKWTTARRVAELAIDMCGTHLGRARTTPSIPRMLRAAPRTSVRPAGDSEVVPSDRAAGLRGLYGPYAPDVLGMARAEPALARPLADGISTIGAEVAHAARHEMAYTLADVVLRRTDLGSAAYPGDAAIDAAAAILSDELDWTDDRRAREIAGLREWFPRFDRESDR